MTSTTIITQIDQSLVVEIHEEHSLCENAKGMTLDHAAKCGALLARVKEDLPHGAWEKWADENLDFSKDTATLYMRIAANPERVPLFGTTIREAKKALAKPRATPQRTPAPTSREASPAVAGMEDDDNIAQTPEWRNLSNLPIAPTSPPTLVVTGWTDGQSRKAQRIKDALCSVLDSLDDSQRDGQSDYNVRETLRSAERTAKDAQVLLSELAFSFDR